MKKTTLFIVLLFIFTFCFNLFSQTDHTAETKINLSSSRTVSGNENMYSVNNSVSNVPQNLVDAYNSAKNSGNEQQKIAIGNEIEQYLSKPNLSTGENDFKIISPEDPMNLPDWYENDVFITSSEVATSAGGYRQIELKQGEDGWMYMAVNRRNVTGFNGYISVYRSMNGGATWAPILNYASINSYYGSISMLVESRDNAVEDSTRVFIYFTASTSQNMNDASVYCWSFRRTSASSYTNLVASPSAGNRFTFPTACSDGMYWQSATYMHLILREETNAGAYVSLKHFRSVNWGISHSVGTLNTILNDKFPASAFSIETGSDSIYIAVEREIAVNEREIRLIATTDLPTDNFRVRYITDAAPGTIYERPDITIQQRDVSLPQRILVTSTKDDRAVYHYSVDGGATWSVDANLGTSLQQVDFTSCSSDSLTAGDGYFIAAFVDLNGDSVSIRRGVLGSMGTQFHKVNTVSSTGVLAPACAIYKEGAAKFSAYAYAGFGPSSVYYNMQGLITGITQTGGNIPDGFILTQNYPNPFNPATTISFSLPKASVVKIAVYDMLGKEVSLLVNEELGAGNYNTTWDAAYYSSGIYFYKMVSNDFSLTKKMILTK